eukprot:CAMPEP_0181368072 /NCGR_PEP_ID=MMETSP1106-20121128/11847_1 /TAXON_ID=81844 /ORGANISM="Mantoniella antarctica, Strain SL-175" /LENGTH=246 /DNA_ID=CAMNT_0023484073 /DNA_START=1793 /DNA_END=2534 /DNA_ORIENTATION=-
MEHAAAVCDSGELFMWGSGSHGKLGLGYEKEYFVPMLVLGQLQGKRVVTISAGTQHTAALTSDNAVFTWGWGKDGRLGHGDEKSKFVPTLVETVTKYMQGCVAVSAGHDHTAAISVNADLLTWGGDPNTVSKLGLGLSFGSAFIRMDPSLVRMPDGFQGWCTTASLHASVAAEAEAAKVASVAKDMRYVGAGETYPQHEEPGSPTSSDDTDNTEDRRGDSAFLHPSSFIIHPSSFIIHHSSFILNP